MELNSLANAIGIFSLEVGVYNFSDIKAIYRRLATVNHPDKGGNTETMQLINKAYGEFSEYFISVNILEINSANESKGINFSFIQELKTMHGIIIEMCGYWVWLRGDTYAHKDKIHALGFKFSKSKKAWYWTLNIKTAGYRRGCKSMHGIRHKYGSTIVATNKVQQLH